MDILIIANFCLDFDESDNGRFSYIARNLSKENDVEIVTSSFNHMEKKQREGAVADWPFRISFLYEPGYPRNVCLKRFYSHLVWGKKVNDYLKTRKEPDVVYCAVPSLSAAYFAANFCKRNNIKFIVDIQDLWPEAYQMVFNVPVVSNLIFLPFKFLANRIYKQADEIVAVSDTYCDRAKKNNKKVDSSHTVFLGTEMELFDKYADSINIEKPNKEVWLTYCGTLGSSYDLKCAIEALDILKRKGYKDLVLKVLGDGPKYNEFVNYSKELDVKTDFLGYLPYVDMCAYLSKSDIALNPITKGAAQSIINKHGDYAMAGIPVVSNQECLEYRNLIDNYQMGYNCVPASSKDFAAKIECLLFDKNSMKEKGENARKCASERFDRKSSYNEIYEAILK